MAKQKFSNIKNVKKMGIFFFLWTLFFLWNFPMIKGKTEQLQMFSKEALIIFQIALIFFLLIHTLD